MPAPTPDIKGIKKFLEYRSKGLTYRDIQKIMGKDLKTLHRWNKYPVGKIQKLSTVQ
jgi:DNA-directed RNA polymerase specialized sigma24 family protein